MTGFASSTPAGVRQSNLTISLLAGTIAPLALALAAPTTAFAQVQPATSPTAPVTEAQLQAVVITGTLIERPGYNAPTPVTSISSSMIQANALPNIANFVNELPEIAGSVSNYSQEGTDISAGTEGLNELNLRDLGTSSTLVLLDGNRIVPTTTSGAVNINFIPTGLVQRVDIVTGGASATYGSDAVAGVVNFILDKTFTGIKANVQGGITTYGDDPQAKMDFTVGEPFASGRGHFLFDAEYTDIAGFANPTGYSGFPRAWDTDIYKRIANPNYTPTNGQPFYLIEGQASQDNATPGGIIVSGPLKGTYFGEGGVPLQYQYGSIVGSGLMSGGDWQYYNFAWNGALDLPTQTYNVFTRFSYDLSDTANVYAQFTYGATEAHNDAGGQYFLGNRTVSAQNPYLPPSVAAEAAADDLTTLHFGSLNADLPITQDHNTSELYAYAIGGDGKFNIAHRSWNWHLFTQYGLSPSYVDATAMNLANYANALDSVREPNGTIVCASTLTNPTNGCVPYDPFGIGVNGPAAGDYLVGLAWRHETTSEALASATVDGEPFSLPGGPVSFALGATYRKEAVRSFVDPTSLLLKSGIPGWSLGNYQPTIGQYHVVEGFAETVVPLVTGARFAKALDLDLAGRATDYSTSGYVTTWKGGVTYSPVESVKFRISRSHDIRAPNLNDLYAGGTAVSASGSETFDPFTGGFVPQYFQNSTGNPALKPEVANTSTFGIVFQPSWPSGFGATVDYYDIDIDGVIASVNAQTVLNNCFAGQTFFCNQISYNSQGIITIINQIPYNYQSQRQTGLDLDVSYQTQLSKLIRAASGTLALRGLITHVYSYTEYTGVQTVQLAGVNSGAGPVSWRWYATAAYIQNPVTLTLTWRGISGGVYSNSYLQCTSGCPPSTTTVMTINDNYIPGASWLDSSIAYRFGHDEHMEIYLSIQNLLNRDPPPVGGTAPYGQNGNGSLYDLLGRLYQFGFRFQM